MSEDHEHTRVVTATEPPPGAGYWLIAVVGLGGLIVGLLIGLVSGGLTSSPDVRIVEVPVPTPSATQPVVPASDPEGSVLEIPEGQSARDTGRMVGEELRRTGVSLREFTIGFNESTGVGDAIDGFIDGLRSDPKS